LEGLTIVADVKNDGDSSGIDPAHAFGLCWEGFAIDRLPEGTLTSVEGVRAGAASAGLKRSGKPDVALISVPKPTPAAAVFTTNKAAAAPVVISARSISERPLAAGVVANSGCANALTGDRGTEAALSMQESAARVLGVSPSDVLVASTGLIGTELPVQKVRAAIESMRLSEGAEAGHLAARAIMTTDTVPKETAVEVSDGRRRVRVGGIAKGAAMLAPSMATMLAFLATDVACDPRALAGVLRSAVAATFNRLSVDACRSTNDTVVLLTTEKGELAVGEDASRYASDVFASLLGGVPSGKKTDVADATEGAEEHRNLGLLAVGVHLVCAELAMAMARDAEGSNKVAVVKVRGAASPADAEAAAQAIASSSLVRCSLFGSDPYWGRIVAEAGSAVSSFDDRSVSVSYGPYRVCAGGVATSEWSSAGLARYMERPEIEIVCDLGVGPFGALRVMTALGTGYVEENMKTS
jgi:glutamate N-acetyltransferase/amino-acid N-acetyltransferase